MIARIRVLLSVIVLVLLIPLTASAYLCKCVGVLDGDCSGEGVEKLYISLIRSERKTLFWMMKMG